MKKIYFVLFAILCTIIFSCTDNLISTDLDSHKNSSTSELKVFVKQSRLFSPLISEISWTVELVDEENNAYSSKETNGYFLFSNLKLGTYTVNASGKDSLGAERFCGAITINFDSAKPLEVFVPVSASKNPNSDITSTGFATITMDMSDELLDILYSMGEGVFLEARLFGIDDTNADLDVSTNFADVTYNDNLEIESIDISDNQQITFAYTDYSQPSQIQTTDIPVGYYNLSFEGLKEFGYSIKLKDNLVEIGDGLTTNIVLTENDYEIVENYYSVLYVNKDGGETADGKTLSNPIAFSTITENNYADLIYLLSDVEFIYDENSNLSPYLDSISGTISSFGSSLYTIKADIPSYTYPIYLGGDSPITLKNVKLFGSNKFCFSNLFVDETVILDCEMDNDSTVQLSKKSNLQIGQNFSGDLYLLLNGDWKLGDTVINFESGKPENSNFYIDSECENFSGQKYSAMFYIDDSGKLAKYTDDFTSFAWTGNIPHLVTKTQAKNNTYTSIYTDFESYSLLYGYNGVSTYDGDKTWYFICENDQSYSLYKVSPSQNYENSVYADVIELPVSDTHGGISLDAVRYMSYDDGKLYFLSQVDYYQIDSYDLTSDELGVYNVEIKLSDDTYPSPTAFYVKGNDFYFATDFIDYNQPDNSITHSAIWKCELTMEETDNGTFYNLIPVQTYQTEDGMEYPVPYYLTQNDNSLTIDNSFPEDSTFRITDLYSDGTSVYGLLANYIETNENNANGNVYMRGSVFKLEENTNRESYEPIMNATHYGLRDSLPMSDISTAKQYFILPRKIVGIVNKKLIIADDGMIPDENDCNLDRFILFDLDGTISEKIDVNVTFTTSGVSSIGNYYTTETLF